MDQLLTIKEAAEYLNVHWQTVRKYIKDGRIESHKVGRSVRISRSDLDKFAGIDSDSDNLTEVERKYIIDKVKRAQIERTLLSLGSKVTFHAHLIDHYLIPSSIMSSDEQSSWFKGKEGFGLRIRETDNDYSGNVITTIVAKKLTKANDHGIHEEIELDIDNYKDAKRFFNLIGMKENVIVDKDRVVYSIDDVKVCIDEIKDAGIGIEIEYRGDKKEKDGIIEIERVAKLLSLGKKYESKKGISYLPFNNAVY